MLAEGNSVSLCGEPYFFKSNDPLLLEEPETICFVQSGSLALFAMYIDKNNDRSLVLEDLCSGVGYRFEGCDHYL